MKKISVLIIVLVYSLMGYSQTDNWMTSLDIAQRLARTQNKPILMVWDEATQYPLPVLVQAANGRNVVVDDLFTSVELNKVLWHYFVPVKVGELAYEDLFNAIKDEKPSAYISKFNDDSLKIMDTNGTIIGTSGAFTELLNITNFIAKYALNTSFLQQELTNYNTDKTFYSTFYLGSKYVDYSVLINKNVRSQVLDVADIYLDEAEMLLNADSELREKNTLTQRLFLTRLVKDLVKNKSRKVLRALSKIETDSIEGANKSLLNFVYYTAHRLRNDREAFGELESEITLVNLKQAQLIVNINR